MLEQIEKEFGNFEKDARAWVGGNKPADARSRKSSTAMTSMFKEWRKQSVKEDAK